MNMSCEQPGVPRSCAVRKPFTSDLDLGSLRLAAPDNVRKGRLADLADLYMDGEDVLDKEGDRVVYEFAQVAPYSESGNLAFGVARIYPGRVGREFHMTRGHFHARQGAAEVYFCLAGEGVLLCQRPEQEPEALPMRPGRIGYVPPGWAHRVINTGRDDLVFLAVVDASAGHDYSGAKALDKRIVAQDSNSDDGSPVGDGSRVRRGWQLCCFWVKLR